MKSKNCLFISFLLVLNMSCAQSEVIPLWENKIPNSQESDEVEENEVDDILRLRKVQNPTLEIFIPTKRSATGRAVIICPGGGYGVLSYDWEGTEVAKWFNTQGIAAFVLKYRLPQSKSIVVQHNAPLQDAQRAIKLVRHHAEKWGVEKDKIGVIGFSAGGHVASTLGTQFAKHVINTEDEINRTNARPDFMALIYPVITMQFPYTHKGSRDNLLGNNPSKELVDEFSNELHVTKNTPPTFIVHSTDDEVVPVENSLNFYKALKDAEVLSEMHIYPHGGHGYGLAIGRGYLQTWTDRLADWLKELK
ncbi:alpha/beta hydrolase [Algibacter sp. 2305UL17-15]|uniref:alpha/beta hydrolase n=1 Tax=Algibacter sp. 2305UL17-15 TaxID=3231268 RepID=UPI00345A0DEA